MGSPLAVFLALRGVRPGSCRTQNHILPRSICNRLFNIFHPTDPVVRTTIKHGENARKKNDKNYQTKKLHDKKTQKEDTEGKNQRTGKFKAEKD